MSTPFVMAPTAIVFDTTLPPLARLLWQALEHHSGEHLTCWPGYATLAKEIGCSVRWIPVLLQRLVAAGLVVIHTRQGKTNLYALTNRIARQPQKEAANQAAKPTHAQATRPPMKPNTYNQKPAPKTNYNNPSKGLDLTKYLPGGKYASLISVT